MRDFSLTKLGATLTEFLVFLVRKLLLMLFFYSSILINGVFPIGSLSFF